MRETVSQDLLLACLVTFFGAALAWILVGGLPFIGIDDAAITRSYSENIARGLGYVYNEGGERVEGSTTLLWALIVTATYALTPTPEILILAISTMLTIGALCATFRATRCLAQSLEASGTLSVAILSVFLLSSPGYFFWTVWTMMEVALWSSVVLWLVACLVVGIEDEPPAPGRFIPGLFLPALLLPLIRPEGIAVAVGLVLMAAILAPAFRGRAIIAAFLSLAVFASVTIFRMQYFGLPFPNTFYAKVSSDRLQDLVDGLKYTASFVLGKPFAEIFVVVWAGAVIWAFARGVKGHRSGLGFLIPAAAVVGFLAVYASLGGDHFALWRFYQPIMPLLPMALAISVAVAVRAIFDESQSRLLALPTLAAAIALIVSGWLHYYQSRFDLRKEFTLVEQGLAFGSYLNARDPRPTIGVGPAGGIALSYDGIIYDLLGLNWTEMAHANPVKVGMRNHASFDKPTFWAHRPDVLATFNRPCSKGDTQSFWAANDDAFDGLFEDDRFREEFRPVRFRGSNDCWPGFATPKWLAAVADDDTVEALGWSDIILVD